MLQEAEFKAAFGKNLEEVRREKGLTQLQLAEKLNYTDKAVSKWERGESVPDTYTVMRIAQTLDVSVSRLTGEERNEYGSRHPSEYTKRKRKIISVFVPAISALGVFFLCSVLHLIMKNIPLTADYAELSYILAVPVMFIVLLVLSFLWWKRSLQFVCLSCLIWSLGITAERLLHSFGFLPEFKYIYVCCALLEGIGILVFIFVHFLSQNKKAKH